MDQFAINQSEFYRRPSRYLKRGGKSVPSRHHQRSSIILKAVWGVEICQLVPQNRNESDTLSISLNSLIPHGNFGSQIILSGPASLSTKIDCRSWRRRRRVIRELQFVIVIIDVVAERRRSNEVEFQVLRLRVASDRGEHDRDSSEDWGHFL